MSEPTKTPKTDALQKAFLDKDDAAPRTIRGAYWEMADHAREMEKQNVALREVIAKCEAGISDLFGQCVSNPIYNSWGAQVDCAKINEAQSAICTIMAKKTNE